MSQSTQKFTPIIDTREQIPLIFDKKYCNDPVKKKLETGDYSIVGLEDIFCIERKKSIEEIAGNIFQKRMENVLMRLQCFKHKAIICEFSYADLIKFPVGSKIRKRLKVTGPFISSWLNNIVITRNIPVIYAGDASKASYITTQMMKLMWIEWIRKSSK
jgi:hypothetical protein